MHVCMWKRQILAAATITKQVIDGASEQQTWTLYACYLTASLDSLCVVHTTTTLTNQRSTLLYPIPGSCDCTTCLLPVKWEIVVAIDTLFCSLQFFFSRVYRRKLLCGIRDKSYWNQSWLRPMKSLATTKNKNTVF